MEEAVWTYGSQIMRQDGKLDNGWNTHPHSPTKNGTNSTHRLKPLTT